MSENLFLGDIEKAFLQVSLKEEDRDLLFNVNWKEKHQRFMLVPFGVKSSPFLPGASLWQHLDQQVPQFEHTITALKQNTYIGSVLWSLRSMVRLFQVRSFHFTVTSLHIFCAKLDIKRTCFWLLGLKNEVYSWVTSLFLLVAYDS